MSEKKRYGLIVIDPPWPIQKVKRRVRSNQKETLDYKTMTLRQVRMLPIRDLADPKGCWVVLWTTQRFLWSCEPLLETWGFSVKFVGAWEKTAGVSRGMPLMGWLWNVEFYVVGHLGPIETYPKQKVVPLAFSAPNEGHSQKPQKFYDLVAPLSDRRADIFARKEREGWDVWGNEVECTVDWIEPR